MAEHSSIYTASNRATAPGEPRKPGMELRRTSLADEVLATLLHELRTPLAVMTGWSRMLQQQYAEHGDEFLRRGLSQLSRYTSSQAALLTRAGDFCELWTGRAALNRERVDLFDLARVALRGLEPTFTQRGVQQAANFEVPEGPVVGDYARLRQMVTDLLASALETTPVGHRLQVHGTVTEQVVVLSLHDVGDAAGHGAEARAPEDLQATPDAEFVPGQLALAIARGLVVLHGGTLTVTPGQHGTGAATTVRLPRCGTSSVRDFDEELLVDDPVFR